MQIRQDSSKICVIEAPAKLNLFLEVHGKRNDGFHEIETLACPISLYDTLEVRAQAGNFIEFVCESDTIDVPSDSTNLAVKALHLLKEHTGYEHGASVWLKKRIPSQAGLGGGSSDAAAALCAGNIVWNLCLSQEELAALGAKLGSDVPLFFADSTVVCRGRGEIVEPVYGIPMLHFVVLKPEIGVATAAVYANCRHANEDSRKKVAPLIYSLKNSLKNSLNLASELFFNRLEEAAFFVCPELHGVRQALKTNFRMSGSGSAFYTLCVSREEAENQALLLESLQIGATFAVRSL